ncbi:hypothetical protein [Paenirhodobacter populi]|uniref:Uncharacterized protein n=1 Tax=Paenirhodobacter populi TaxID=2306993 RepID=A0A443J4F0_9RHOB|nr:hypothetical protein [Sinirhodobacter populi]RWR15362.1 hypothetical protein D2T33_00345 [Sinirhodobacter populi]
MLLQNGLHPNSGTKQAISPLPTLAQIVIDAVLPSPADANGKFASDLAGSGARLRDALTMGDQNTVARQFG